MTTKSKATPKVTDKTRPTLTPAQRDEIKSKVQHAREAGSKARFEQAQVTHLVFSTPGAVGESGLYLSQGAYAEALGVSSSTVSQLKVLGLAISKGLTVDNAGWAVVSQNAAAKAVREAAQSARATKAGVASIVAAARKTKATNDAPKVDTRKATKATDAESPAPVLPRNNSGRLDMIETMLAALTTLSPAERKRLAEIGERVQVILTPAAKSA